MNTGASKMDGPSGQSGQGGSVSSELATRLSDPARELQHERDLDRVLSGIVQAAVQLIPGDADASISVVTGRDR